MIADHDRSGWFGASDTGMILGNWNTKTFQSWWATKLGIRSNGFTTKAMYAGTYFEHSILDAVGAPRKDYQILIPELRLRVNLDGDAPVKVWEVKTHSASKVFKPTKAHRQQVNVQMFAKLHEEGVLPVAEVVSYGLTDDDYKNFFNDIDPERLKTHSITYDEELIRQYLRRIEYLGDCLEKGVWPDARCPA